MVIEDIGPLHLAMGGGTDSNSGNRRAYSGGSYRRGFRRQPRQSLVNRGPAPVTLLAFMLSSQFRATDRRPCQQPLRVKAYSLLNLAQAFSCWRTSA